jgi:predicted esterase
MSDFQARVLATPTHGHYLIAAPAGDASGPLLVGFHGYGQSAEQHLGDLRRLPGLDGALLVSVQALHLFYARSQDVVGSWMTRQGRELAIEDNVRYVASVVERVRAEFPRAGRLAYLGFSQGASMAYRAAAFAGHACHALVALGGDLPPDVAHDANAPLPPVLIGRGRHDSWFTREKVELDLRRLSQRGLNVRLAEFEGGHEWRASFEAEAAAFLRAHLLEG